MRGGQTWLQRAVGRGGSMTVPVGPTGEYEGNMADSSAATAHGHPADGSKRDLLELIGQLQAQRIRRGQPCACGDEAAGKENGNRGHALIIRL